MKIEEVIPKDGPSIYEVEKYIKKYSNESIVVKAGGSVLLDENLFNHRYVDLLISTTILPMPEHHQNEEK